MELWVEALSILPEQLKFPLKFSVRNGEEAGPKHETRTNEEVTGTERQNAPNSLPTTTAAACCSKLWVSCCCLRVRTARACMIERACSRSFCPSVMTYTCRGGVDVVIDANYVTAYHTPYQQQVSSSRAPRRACLQQQYVHSINK